MQLIPGVQEGKRLTLDSVNNRVADLESVVAALCAEVYGIEGGESIEDATDRLLAAEIGVDEIDSLIPTPKAFVAGGCVNDSLADLADSYRLSLEQENSALKGLIETLTEERDQAIRDSEHWQREAGDADDQAASIQDELDDLRSKLHSL